MYTSDTIAAIATPAGSGGVGVIRISGPEALRIGGAIFRGAQPLEAWQSHRLYLGHVVDAHEVQLDSGLAVLMRAPNSYSGEDVVELHCHGSPLVLRSVLRAVLHSGARAAAAGEFTKRAFLNGRIDLTQAEAVADLIGARSSAAAQVALGQLDGYLSGVLQQLRSDLIGSKAWLEVQIDFSDEDVAVDSAEIARQIMHSGEQVATLLASYAHGRILREGLRVALIGKPNVGKSSLLNALLGSDRAIVTAIAGTTRDTIEESLSFDAVPVVLIDTAGLRDDGDSDAIERIGMRRTQEALVAADVIVCVFDASAPLDDADRAVLELTKEQARVLVLNKCDLLAPTSHTSLAAALRVSATHGTGLDALRRAVVAEAAGSDCSSATVVLNNARHHAALQCAHVSLTLVLESLQQHHPPDVVAVDLQDAIDRIAEITGMISSEDVLDRIFSEFCIGK